MPKDPERIDMVARGISRLPSQDQADAEVVALVTALLQPFQTLHDAMFTLLDDNLDNATGDSLDQKRRLAGAPAGADDATTRKQIRAQLAAARSTGSTEAIIKVVRAVLGGTSAGGNVRVQAQRIADFVTRIEGLAVTHTVAEITIALLQTATKAGARAILESSTGSPPWFTDGVAGDGSTPTLSARDATHIVI